jgi:hypothetical protein
VRHPAVADGLCWVVFQDSPDVVTRRGVA